ncbi:Ldh family oxidoreductase [Microtetraspora malaysiensis]|uniref:Ldh family oxidoreductase n=1 Tax=Microtetraspora malaysiensis TaxID=161358 RepID=UPI003D8F6E57
MNPTTSPIRTESPAGRPEAAAPETVRVRYADLLDFTSEVFTARGLDPGRAREAARALCYGDLTGFGSHGLVNLTRIYLPQIDEGRIDPRAEPRTVTDRGAAVLIDAGRALGLWMAGAAMDVAVDRAAQYGIGVAAVRGATHLGCAGHHALRAVDRGMIGLVASNCGRQRIARPPGGAVTMLGTNPLSVAAPAGGHPPFVLDMSTTAAPTGRIRRAARAGRPVPDGLLRDDGGAPVTDPAAFDAGRAHLMWLGGEAGQYKGFGLGIAVEVLAALVPGAGLGAHPDALAGDGGPSGRDDDIGFFAMAVAPGALRPGTEVDARTLFGALLACPPADPDRPVRYPGWHEHRRAEEHLRTGVPLDAAVYADLGAVAASVGLSVPGLLEDR